MSIKSISSVADLLEWHAEQKQLLQQYNKFECGYAPISFDCFFRGMSSRNYELVPSIYRRASLLQNEDKIVADCLAQRPQDFREDKSTFERLVRMQHYGIPTRLLDVTKSPLVALYFAAQSGEKKHKVGKLTSVFVSQQNMKYADSDTVSEVANIANMSYKYWRSFFPTERYCQYLKTMDEHTKKEYIPEYNETPYITQLYQHVLREKTYFQPRLEKEDLEHVWCVIPPMSNDRIRRQRGAFLLFGVVGRKRHCIKIIEKDTAELLLEAMDILERLTAVSSSAETTGEAKEKIDMMFKSLRNLTKYFKNNHTENNSLYNSLKDLSPRSHDFCTEVRVAYEIYIQQILEKSAERIINIEIKAAEGTNVDEDNLEDLARHKFFCDILCGNRIVFQTSVEVQNKSGILQELKDLGITKSYLFPDLSSVGEEINARYPANQGKETLS